MTLTTGQLLAQRYRLGQRIAAGGMGEVWAATDTRLDRQVAVKVLRTELSGDAEFRHRFHTEARLTASLNHPGIAAVHDYGETAGPSSMGRGAGSHAAAAGIAYLVMELVAGDSLATMLQRHRRLSAEHTLDILEQAAEALQAAHERGLVHRDIKPGNILITPAGRVKLTDFGIAKAADAAPVTRHGMVMGTAHYIAPEQAAGDAAGPASDVYSLGVVGYECLAGQRPFRSDNTVTVAMMHIRDVPPALPPGVPLGARALIETALVKDPRQRYHTGGEFAAAISAVRAGRPLPPPAGSTGTTTVLSGAHPALGSTSQPQTALLPPGALSGPIPGPPTGPRTGPYARSPASYHPPQPRSGRRATIAVAMALLVALSLVLGAYGIRQALRANGTTLPGAGPGTDTAQQTGSAAAPTPSAAPSSTGSASATEESTAESTTADDEPGEVFINPGDYLFRSGEVAAARAADHGLEPLVVDPDGDEIDPEDQAGCRVTQVDPPFGAVPPGSRLQLTCREGW